MIQEGFRLTCDGKLDANAPFGDYCLSNTPFCTTLGTLMQYAARHGWTEGRKMHYCPNCKLQNKTPGQATNEGGEDMGGVIRDRDRRGGEDMGR